MNRERIIKILLRVNLARRISDHLLGQEHPLKHRMMVGGGLMVVGVTIAHMSYGYFSFGADLVGYMIHGAGTIPFMDWLTQKRMRSDKRVERMQNVAAHTTYHTQGELQSEEEKVHG